MRFLVVILTLFAGPSGATDYSVRVGDLLRIEVIEDSSLNRNALVLPDGTIAFPMVGQVRAAGLSLGQLRAALSQKLAPNFVNAPSLHVAVASLGQKPQQAVRAKQVRRAVTTEAKTLDVFGMGELGKPGKQRVAEGATLMQFVAQAGGLTAYAASKRVQVRRTDRKTGAAKVFRINLKRMMSGGGGAIFGLQHGDVVIVPERRLFE